MSAADRLRSAGDHKAASELYEKVIEKDPSKLGNDYWEVMQTFERAGRSVALMEAVGKSDPAKWGQAEYAIPNFLSNTIVDGEEQKKAATAAFKTLWENHPNFRERLFSMVRNPELRGLDGVYEYGVDQLLGAGGRPGWDEVNDIRVWGRTPQSEAGVLLDAAQQRGALDDLIAELRENIEAAPDWHAGRGLLAAALAKADRPDEAAGSRRRPVRGRRNRPPGRRRGVGPRLRLGRGGRGRPGGAEAHPPGDRDRRRVAGQRRGVRVRPSDPACGPAGPHGGERRGGDGPAGGRGRPRGVRQRRVPLRQRPVRGPAGVGAPAGNRPTAGRDGPTGGRPAGPQRGPRRRQRLGGGQAGTGATSAGRSTRRSRRPAGR